MTAETMTAEELAMIRAYRAKKQREFWARMTPDERRERRNRYELNAAKKAAERERSENK